MAHDEQRTFELKKLSREGIPAAMEKMKRYRLLNEPENAESICRDILAVEPGHRDAKIGLLLCITDQFGHDLQRRWAQASEIGLVQ